MIKNFFLLVFTMLSLVVGAQVQTQVIGDSVRIRGNTGPGELIVENSSKNVNGFLYNKGNGRTEFRNQYVPQTLTDSSTVVWNLNNGSFGIVTLTGSNRTVSITNPIAWHNYKLKIVQDGSGGRTITTWPANVLWPNGTPPTLSLAAAAVDMIDFLYDGTNYYAEYQYKYASQADLAIYAYDIKYNSAPTVHTLTGVPPGALLVLTCAAGIGFTDASVSSSPSIAWTKQADAAGVYSGDAEIYTAVFTAGGSITITSDFGSTDLQSSTCYVVINQEATLSGASDAVANQTDPSITISSTRAKSILFCVTSDWAAINGSGRDYRSSASETMYRYYPGEITFYHYYKEAPTTGSYTIGLSDPSGQGAGTAVLEIRGK